MKQTNGKYTYYPGCSSLSAGHAYETSLQHVIKKLGITFEDVDDWNCCGATEYFSVNGLPAYSLVARNLSLASQNGADQLITSCSACYLNLRKTEKNMSKFPKLNQQVNRALAAGGLHYEAGKLRVRHLLDILTDDIGLDRIEAQVKKPLKGLRVAPYYGCLIVRPETEYDTEYPTHLDDLLRSLGATVIDFPMKTHCCGGHMPQISEGIAFELLRRLLHNAQEYGADTIATICPMCQLNLDAFQSQVNRTFDANFNMPILFFTQLMGIAFGLPPKELGIGTEIVSATTALKRIGQEEPPASRKPKKRDKNALPMPTIVVD